MLLVLSFMFTLSSHLFYLHCFFILLPPPSSPSASASICTELLPSVHPAISAVFPLHLNLISENLAQARCSLSYLLKTSSLITCCHYIHQYLLYHLPFSHFSCTTPSFLYAADMTVDSLFLFDSTSSQPSAEGENVNSF